MENKTVYWICIMLLRHNDADPDPSQQEFKKEFLVAQVGTVHNYNYQSLSHLQYLVTESELNLRINNNVICLTNILVTRYLSCTGMNFREKNLNSNSNLIPNSCDNVDLMTSTLIQDIFTLKCQLNTKMPSKQWHAGPVILSWVGL